MRLSRGISDVDAICEDATVALGDQTGACRRRLVDTLPKHWGGAGSAAVSGQLDDKTNQHGALLHALEDGGCLPRLPASVLRSVPAISSADAPRLPWAMLPYLQTCSHKPRTTMT